MKIYAPKYYKSFKCIADKCTHSCCVGWEIDVDCETLEKYKALRSDYAKEIEISIDCSGAPHFKLARGDRCPHLNDCGLCRIILEVGEEYLCDICREHPRFYNDTVLGREVGLGMSCEEACRLILSSDGYDEFVLLSEDEGEEPCIFEFDTLPYRKELFSILSDSTVEYSERLEKISETFGVSPSVHSDSEWAELLSSLEYLYPEHKELFLSFSYNTYTPKELEKPLERALAYFIFRHCAEVYDESELVAAVGFSLLCERLLASVAVANRITDFQEFVEIARIVSEELEYSEENTEQLKCCFLFD